MLPPDFNPILDEGAPTSTGGIQNAMKLADALGLNFNLQPVSQPYLVGWGDCGANPKKVIFNWTFTINKSTTVQNAKVKDVFTSSI